MTASIAALAAALWLGAAPAEKIPYYFDKELTAEDLKGLTLRELDLVRNTIFARQGNQFRKKWLREYFQAQPWYRPRDPKDQTRAGARDEKNAAFVASFAADIPQDVLRHKIGALEKKASWTTEDEIEAQLAGRSLGVMVAKPTGVAAAAMTPLDDPSKLDGLIDPATLADLSRRDLRILRNLIYARRGRPFKSALLREYFERMAWYKADPAYTDARLTKNDKRNVKLVQDAESEFGGPMTEAEMRGDDAGAFLGAA